jgi:hypothetical protein
MYTLPWFERQMQTDSIKNDRTVILQKIVKLIKSLRISKTHENIFTKAQNCITDNKYNTQAGVGK